MPDSSALEHTLVVVRKAWKEVLGESPESDTADFLANGGNSLTAINLIFLLEDMTGQPVPLRLLLENGSPRGIAAHLEQSSRSA